MGSADSRAALAQIEALSKALAAAAQAGEWREVLSLDETRYRLLAELPANCFDSDDAYVKSVLEQALAVTRTVLDEARVQQTREAGSLRELHRGHRGARAYLSSGG
ncbi:MAG: hypothetical protein AB7I32_14980 [Gammaproteobacteria bacterium]